MRNIYNNIAFQHFSLMQNGYTINYHQSCIFATFGCMRVKKYTIHFKLGFRLNFAYYVYACCSFVLGMRFHSRIWYIQNMLHTKIGREAICSMLDYFCVSVPKLLFVWQNPLCYIRVYVQELQKDEFSGHIYYTIFFRHHTFP